MNGSEREALALHLWDEGIVRPEDFGLQIIDAILADGYSIKREPREVTTVAELDALPAGSVVMVSTGFDPMVALKPDRTKFPNSTPGFWEIAGSEMGADAWGLLHDGMVAVAYTPEANE